MKSKKVIAKNKKAYHDFEIIDTYEAGVVLTGAEVKSIKEGNLSLKESYAGIKGEEVFVFNMHVAQYKQARAEHDSKRARKLLLHKSEIRRLQGKLAQQGLTLVPLQIYLLAGKIKFEIGLAKGKTLYDKRKTIAEKTAKREIEKEIRRREKGF